MCILGFITYFQTIYIYIYTNFQHDIQEISIRINQQFQLNSNSTLKTQLHETYTYATRSNHGNGEWWIKYALAAICAGV